ncbi:hypothetical protein CHS0354_021197 [Potamilus streckersoni]|uniref:Ubiquitin carboxyl-terminal hydrolase n=1 Tax=Potamilus streckersoni TaxID=2493646 RepID=A0AAE0SS30_9BIVA|nr:hypothetical protein CHS0354_021197 [Potamilus streckersoni]
MSDDKKQRWIPLESNPEVLNKYIHNLGVPSSWQFVDVYGLEPDLLAMVPRPVVAVMLLYPLTDKSQQSTIGEVQEGSDLYFIKQTIGNACGTIAIVHALANNRDKIQFIDEKSFSKFLSASLNLTPEEKASLLENDEGMGAAHEDSAQEGQTQAPDRNEQVNTHFIAFMCQNDGLYELDGRKDGPVHHGTSSSETLLEHTGDDMIGCHDN